MVPTSMDGLSDGTLVMASKNSQPAFGAWTYQGGALTMTEDGQAYKADVLAGLSGNVIQPGMVFDLDDDEDGVAVWCRRQGL